MITVALSRMLRETSWPSATWTTQQKKKKKDVRTRQENNHHRCCVPPWDFSIIEDQFQKQQERERERKWSLIYFFCKSTHIVDKLGEFFGEFEGFLCTVLNFFWKVFGDSSSSDESSSGGVGQAARVIKKRLQFDSLQVTEEQSN